MARITKKAGPTPAAKKGLTRIVRPATLAAQVEQLLRRAIDEGRFPEGRLPPEVDLADQLGVSRETVRLAADALQREGLLIKYRRKGTFVRPPPLSLAPRAPALTVVAYLQADYDSGPDDEGGATRATGASILQGTLREAREAGLDIVVRQAPGLRLGEAFEQLHRGMRLCGVILASFAEDKLLRRISGLGLPMVLADHDLHLPQLSSVRDDSFEAARQAVAHLAGLGHRNIAFIGWRQTDLNPWRLRGYRQGLRDAGLTPRRRCELPVALTEAGADGAVGQWLALSPRPTAMYCFNNTLARFVIDALRRRGLRAPHNVSVLGGGGEEVLGLTHHQADWHGIGRAAVQILGRILTQADKHTPEHLLFSHRLRPGDTTAAP